MLKNYEIFKLIQEEHEEYKKLKEERQDIIKENAKLKDWKKPQLEVPY